MDGGAERAAPRAPREEGGRAPPGEPWVTLSRCARARRRSAPRGERRSHGRRSRTGGARGSPGGERPRPALPAVRNRRTRLRARFRARGARVKLSRMAHPLHSSRGRFRLRDLLPFGPGRHPRPRPYVEMAKLAWENRDNLAYAWRILAHGVCDGCSLGPRGLRDDVIDGVHLCMTRLRLLRLNTMGPIPESRRGDLTGLRAPRNEQLH